MRKDITIAAEPREGRGKNEARRLRVKGQTPAVLYGAGLDSVAVAVSPREVNRILRSATGHNTIFNLQIDSGDSTPVMLTDWQRDPVKDTLLHVDLKRIDLTKRITIKVPIHMTGDAKGVKLQGGLLEAITREIEIDCLPDEIPDMFTIDVTELNLGQSLRASDVPMVGSMKLLSAPEQVLAHVIALKAEPVPEAEAAAAAPTTAEPEVIKKGKKDEEGAAAEPKAEAKKAEPKGEKKKK
jgi:large subunit ribosomal protein L25